jgi:signal transduction histidine kinase
VQVEDDGVGLPENGVATSLGLAGMRSRIESIGGQFDVRRRQRRGTLVSVTVPVEARSAPARGRAKVGDR